MPSHLHDPVLLDPVIDIFTLPSTKKHIVIDATLGLWGHASELCQHMKEEDIFIGLDRDSENLKQAQSYIENTKPRVKPLFVHSSFSGLRNTLEEHGIDAIDFILYDLGVSSVHYDDADRGFSLRGDGPLDMRFDRTTGKTASDLIHTLDARMLSQIFTDYGEEKKGWFVAQAIVKTRAVKKIETTFELLEIIESSSFDKKSPIRIFQALRIALNEEFLHIESSLKQALELLSVWGKICVITFHSLEDRLVKNIFAPYLEDMIDEVTGQIREKAHFKKYTKKPIIPTDEEISYNPRSRSAKMRIIEKIA